MKKNFLAVLFLFPLFLSACGVANVSLEEARIEETQVDLALVQAETIPVPAETVQPTPAVTPTEDRSGRMIAALDGVELEVKTLLFTPDMIWVEMCTLSALDDNLEFFLSLEWQDYRIEDQMGVLTAGGEADELGRYCSRIQVLYGFDALTYQLANWEILPADEEEYVLRLSEIKFNHMGMGLTDEKCAAAREKLHQENPDVNFTCADGIIQAEIVYPATMDVGTAWNLINESFFERFDGEIVFSITENASQQVVFINQPVYQLVSVEAEENPDHPFELVGVKGDDGYLEVGICYQLPREDTLDWMLSYPIEAFDRQKSVTNTSGTLIEYQNRGLDGTFRCEWIGFMDYLIRNDADFPQEIQLTLPAIESPMPEGMTNCADVQARLDADETGIRIECEVYVDPNGGGGGGGFLILDKPEDMSEEEALNLVALEYASDKFKGPWTFSLQRQD